MKPSIGRIVHFVQEKPTVWQKEGEPKILVHLPAIITAAWSDTCVNLQVFTDGTNSDDANISSVKWITSVSLDENENPSARTWHWPERIE